MVVIYLRRLHKVRGSVIRSKGRIASRVGWGELEASLYVRLPERSSLW